MFQMVRLVLVVVAAVVVMGGWAAVEPEPCYSCNPFGKHSKSGVAGGLSQAGVSIYFFPIGFVKSMVKGAEKIFFPFVFLFSLSQ